METHSVTIRLTDADYNLLSLAAVAADVSPTSLAKEIVCEAVREGQPVAGIEEIEPQSLKAEHEPVNLTEAEPSDPSCIRAARHEPGVPCPICQAA